MADASSEPAAPPPFQPRPKLFVALLVIFVLWLGFLVFLNATT
jgi:hypothetical protein